MTSYRSRASSELRSLPVTRAPLKRVPGARRLDLAPAERTELIVLDLGHRADAAPTVQSLSVRPQGAHTGTSRFGQLLLVIGGGIGVAVVVGLLVGFESAALHTWLVYHLTVITHDTPAMCPPTVVMC